METCIDCGQEFENEGRRKKPYCIPCAYKRAHEAAEQMAKREGPYYEKWLQSKDKAVKNFRARMERTAKKYEEALDIEYHLATPEGQAEMLMRYGNLRQGLQWE